MNSALKITDAEIALHGIQGKPNKLPGPVNANKAAFDELISEVVKGKHNGLVDALTGQGGAGGIGIAPISGIEAANIQAAILELLIMMQGITQGAVANGSITTVKLADGAVTEDKLGSGAVTEDKLGSGTVTGDKLAADAVTTEKVADYAVTTGKLRNGAVSEGKIADGAVTAGKIADGAVERAKIAAGAINADKLTDLAVTTAKLAAGAVTAAKLASNLTYAVVGLNANQVRPIYVQASVPTSSSPDGIYLVTG